MGGNSAVQTVITKECHLLLRQHGIIKCVATLYYVIVATQHFIVKNVEFCQQVQFSVRA